MTLQRRSFLLLSVTVPEKTSYSIFTFFTQLEHFMQLQKNQQTGAQARNEIGSLFCPAFPKSFIKFEKRVKCQSLMILRCPIIDCIMFL